MEDADENSPAYKYLIERVITSFTSLTATLHWLVALVLEQRDTMYSPPPQSHVLPSNGVIGHACNSTPAPS